MHTLSRWFVLALASWAFAAFVMAQAHAPFVALQPEDIRLADGATQTVIMGDPSKHGMYVVQNVFEPVARVVRIFHDQDRYITVVNGTWWGRARCGR